MKRARKRTLLNAGLAVAVVAAGAGGYVLVTGSSSQAAATTGLRTVAVTKATVTASVSADGSVEAVSEVAANFATSGTVDSIRHGVGSTVKARQVLATLDTDDAERALDVAGLNLDAAQEQLDVAEAGTTTTDPETGEETTTVDDSQVAQAKANVAQQQGNVDDAEAALDATVLEAPISGTVLALNGKVGSTVSGSGGASSGSTTGSTTGTSTSDFVVIADMAHLQVSVSFSEADIAHITKGQAATITFPAVEGASAKGRVASISPTATTSNSVVTYAAVVAIDTPPADVRLGQSASVTITTATAKAAVVVPSVAVTTTGGRSTVTVVKNGQQSVRTVATGVVGDTYTQVTSGLAAGEQVVLTSATTGSPTQTTGGFPGGGAGIPGGGAGIPGGGAPAGGTGGGR